MARIGRTGPKTLITPAGRVCTGPCGLLGLAERNASVALRFTDYTSGRPLLEGGVA